MAFPGTYNFNYYRGDTHEFVISPKNSDNTAFELDNYVGGAAYVIAPSRGSSGVANKKDAEAIVNTLNDTITCTILPETGRQLTPGTYYYDVQLTGSTTDIITILTGTITVTDDVAGAQA